MTDTAQQAAEAFQGSTDAASAAPVAIPDDSATNGGAVSESNGAAHTLFANVREEIEGLVDLSGHEWDLLKAAITKHL